MNNDYLHPELYTWDIDWERWCKKFIHPQTLSKDWNAIVEERGADIYTWPMFTKDFCEMIIEEAEHQATWTVDRHANYPTTDFLLQEIGLREMYMKVLHQFGFKIAAWVWGLSGKQWHEDMDAELFMAKYTPEAQGHLDSHIDNSNYSITLALNDDFKGGGTYYHRQKTLVKAPTGHQCLFPMPTHKHSGRWIDEGLRYIIVAFCVKGGSI
tara:strand:+ start:3656 stop:4288 length:633 start_codon:yes stop_codon:yes gene_type:complete